jgi:hypothetical protein
VIAKCHSEQIFEAYLRSLSLNFVYEPKIDTRNRRPDYQVDLDRHAIWFEIKEFRRPKIAPRGSFDPTRPIKEKIDQARKKFKEFKDSCCVLVLHGCESIYRNPMLPSVVSAAFGEYVILEPACGQTVRDEPMRFRFHGGAKLRPDSNTTLSAIVLLQHFQLESRWTAAYHRVRRRIADGEPVGPLAYALELQDMIDDPNAIEFKDSVRAIVLENPYCRFALPSSLPSGPLDQRWGLTSDSGWYSLLTMGPELVRLRARVPPTPFIFL